MCYSVMTHNNIFCLRCLLIIYFFLNSCSWLIIIIFLFFFCQESKKWAPLLKARLRSPYQPFQVWHIYSYFVQPYFAAVTNCSRHSSQIIYLGAVFWAKTCILFFLPCGSFKVNINISTPLCDIDPPKYHNSGDDFKILETAYGIFLKLHWSDFL